MGLDAYFTTYVLNSWVIHSYLLDGALEKIKVKINFDEFT